MFTIDQFIDCSYKFVSFIRLSIIFGRQSFIDELALQPHTPQTTMGKIIPSKK
jgi:hypothetical protein